VSEALETTTPGSTIGRKVRSLAIGAMVTAGLAVPAVTAVSVVSHEAGRAPVYQPAPFRGGPVKSPVISPDSHRLALTLKPNSVRLT
jgi:hypothetical protein